MTTTHQEGQTRDEKGRITGGIPPVGFHTNPERISPGGWSKETSMPYLINKFGRMSDEEVEEYIESKGGKKKLSQFEKAAITRTRNTTLSSEQGLRESKEVMDRTNGKAPQSIDLTTGGEKMNNPYAGLTIEELRKIANG